MHQLAQIVNLLVRIETLLIFARVLLSWFPGIPPWHPLVRALAAVTDPVLLPFRRMLPTIGGLDFSPIVAIVVLQVVGQFVVDLIEHPHPDAPYGAKGVGEPPTISSTPAIVAAIRAATGRELNRVPVSPDDIVFGAPYRSGWRIAPGDDPRRALRA